MKKTFLFRIHFVFAAVLSFSPMVKAVTVLNENFESRTLGAVAGAFGNFSFTGTAFGSINGVNGTAQAFSSANTGRYNLSIAASSTGTADPASAPSALIATFSNPVEAATANPAVISFKTGSYGNNSSQSFKAMTVRGLSSTGQEVFELWVGFGSSGASTKIFARSAAQTTYVNNPTEGSCVPAGTSIYTGFAFPNSVSANALPASMPTFTITIQNSQVTYGLSSGTAGGTLTFAINSSATDIAKLEFVNINNLTTQNAGFWIDDLLVTGTVIATPPPVYPVTWTAKTDNVWNSSNTNWTDTLTGTTNTAYLDTENVTFNDNASNTLVTVTNIVSPGTITINNTVSNYVFAGAGAIVGGGSLTKTGNASLTLALTNNNYGATTISAGTLKVGAPGAIPVANVTVNGTLNLAGFDVSMNSLTGTGTLTNSGSSGTNLLVIGFGNAAFTFDGVIKDGVTGASTTLIKTNTGNIVLNAAQSYRGETYLRNGNLTCGGVNILPTNSLVYIGGLNLAANLLMNGFDQTLRGLVTGGSGSNSRRVYNGSATAAVLTLNTPAGETNVYGHTLGLAGDANGNNFSLVKTGAGEQRINTCTYAGTTTVNNGALIFVGSAISATNTITVNSGGSLGGNGSVGGPVILNNGARLTPGVGGIGTLTLSNSLTMNATVTNWFEVNNDTATNDYVTNLTDVSYGGVLVVTNVGTAAFTNNQVLQLFSATGTVNNNFASIIILPATGATGSFNPATGQLTISVQAATTTTLTRSIGSNPSTYGAALTLQATVNPAPADGAVITFKDGVAAIGTGITTSGIAIWTTSALAAGFHSLTAIFPGDASNLPSTSSALSQTVNSANTFVGASSTKNPSGYTDSVSFTATLPADATGSVVFFSPNGSLSTNPVVGGSAGSGSLSTLPRGTNLITVAYLGDGNYLGSTNTFSQIVTNHPPVVNNANFTRHGAINSFKFPVNDLLTNATDADGDTLALVSVGPPTNNATLSVAGNYLLYYSTNAAADHFSFTVSDGYGGTNSATVNLSIDSTPLFGQSQLASTTGGTATLNFAGVPGYSYSVGRSVDLSSWTVIWTTNAPVGGVFQFIDTSAPPTNAFYRLQFNP